MTQGPLSYYPFVQSDPAGYGFGGGGVTPSGADFYVENVPQGPGEDVNDPAYPPAGLPAELWGNNNGFVQFFPIQGFRTIVEIWSQDIWIQFPASQKQGKGAILEDLGGFTYNVLVEFDIPNVGNGGISPWVVPVNIDVSGFVNPKNPALPPYVIVALDPATWGGQGPGGIPDYHVGGHQKIVQTKTGPWQTAEGENTDTTPPYFGFLTPHTMGATWNGVQVQLPSFGDSAKGNITKWMSLGVKK